MSAANKKRTVYAPSYYQKFQCIADRCGHTCCTDWQVCIDQATYAKYQKMDDMINTIEVGEDGPCFRLCEDGRCPHLNKAGLCSIILSHGAAYLSEICRNHPRFYNRMQNGRTEAGLGIVCEEACRLILEDKTPFFLYKVDELDEENEADRFASFDSLPQRDRMISMLEENGSLHQKIAALQRAFRLPALLPADGWVDRLLELEILDARWEQDLQSVQGKSFGLGSQYSPCYLRLLIYFIYRHVSVASNEENLRARLAFCIFSVAVIGLLFEENHGDQLEDLIDWARRYSAEIEYSEDNTDELIFAFESMIRRGETK